LLKYTDYVDQQTFKPEWRRRLRSASSTRLWTFDVYMYSSVHCRRQSVSCCMQPLVCGTVFHRTSLISLIRS